MGKRKYNAPENNNEWVPVIKCHEWKNNCIHSVLSKAICGCINKKHLNDWIKKEIFIVSCLDCKNYEQKEEPKPKEKTRKTTRIKKQSKKEKSKN